MAAAQSTALKPSLADRINIRIIAFVAVMAMVIGFPAYVFIDSALSGGIKDRGDGYKEVDLKAMSTFNFDQNNGRLDDVPQKWRDLNGKKVVVRGEMYAPNAASDRIPDFELVYSIAKCCVTTAPQIQHFVKSKAVNNDGRVPFYTGLVQVWGTLHVDVKTDEGKVVSVYQLDVERVEQI